MRVVLVHDWFTGAGQDLRTLQSLAALFPDSKIATMYYDYRHFPLDIARHQIQTSFLQKIPGKAKYSYHLMPVYLRAVKQLNFSDIDLVISNTRGFAKGAIVSDSVLNVCYLHQPMPFAWQPLDLQYPQNEINPIRYKFIANLSVRFRQWDLETASRVGLFIANSESSQRAIKRIYGRPSQIIYPPIDTDYFTPEQSNRGEYYLIVGPTNRNRGIEIAIEAFHDIREKLIIAGDGLDFYRLVNKAPSNVSFTGHVEDIKLRQLYRECRALILTSQSDFSMAVIEAAACGKPVICLGECGVRETLGEQIGPESVKMNIGAYGIYAGERSAAALKEAIKMFNQVKFDSGQLRNNALRFSKQIFFNNMRDFMTEAYSLFRRDGLIKLEQRLLG
jgi:glycosyltransferase involved in cell wall biosynthesis